MAESEMTDETRIAAALAGLGLLLFVVLVIVLSHISERDSQNKLDDWKPQGD